MPKTPSEYFHWNKVNVFTVVYIYILENLAKK